MKKRLIGALCLCLALCLSACGLALSGDAGADGEETDMIHQIDIEVNGQIRTAVLSQNPSAEAFYALLQDGPLTLDMHDYGGFEKVGDLGTSLPRSDEQITTSPGDIILYLGNSVTIYYDVNSWNFTLLGYIQDATGENMREFLGGGNPTVTFSLHAEP